MTVDERKIILDFLHTERSRNKIAAVEKFLSRFGSSVASIIRKRYGSQEADGDDNAALLLNLIENRMTLAQFRKLKPTIDSPSLAFVRGRRTSEEYAIDLVLGWVIEDFVVLQCEEGGLHVEYTGVDRERKFLSSRKGMAKVKVTSDLYLPELGSGFDVKSDYTGAWVKNKGVDIKPEAFGHLRAGKLSVVGVDIIHGLFRVVTKNALSRWTPAQTQAWQFRNPNMDEKLMYRVPLEVAAEAQAADLVSLLSG